MIKKNSGFTLVELLAVIAVLAIVITVAGSTIFGIMSSTREKMSKEVRSHLAEVAISYIIENKTLSKCSTDFDPKSPDPEDNKCFEKVPVKDLIDYGLFEDNQGFCDKNEDYAIVYRYNDGTNSEYQAYISDGMCNNR